MRDNQTNGFNFDDFEDISSSTDKSEMTYEDIISDSSMYVGGEESVDISSYARGKHIAQRRGGKFKRWWRKLSRGKRRLIVTAASIFTVAALLVSWFFIEFRYNYDGIFTTDFDKLGIEGGMINENIINVALFGVDSRDETVFEGNTDSIMILSLNTETKKIKIISVMRDTFVPMEYEGKSYYGKINSAYSKGAEHAVKTLNQIYNLDISEYATVNFFGMVDIIDAVGGIDATITQDELTWKGTGHPNLNNCMDEICREMGLNASEYYIKSTGEQHLNGVQAVAYARVRHCTSTWGTRDDFGRTDRQRHVMKQLFSKAVTMSEAQYVKLAKALIPCSKTSLSYSQILGLAVNILLHSPTFEEYRLPPAEYQSKFLMTAPSGYGSVIYYDLDYASKLIHAVIYDDVTMEEYIELNGVERKSWYKGGSGSSSSSGSGGAQTGNSVPQNVTSEDTPPIDTPQSDTNIDDTSQPVEDLPTEDSDADSDIPSPDDEEEDDQQSDSTQTDTPDDDASSDEETSADDGENVGGDIATDNKEDDE